jgi:uncharacterized protein (TIGR03437 family)
MFCRFALAVLLAAVTYGQQQETVTYAYNGFPLPIFEDDDDVITVAVITVPRALTISNVTARVQIDYPNSGDLKVYLFSPSGIRTRLIENECSTNGIDTTFDDAAPSRWSEFCPAELGRAPFRANEPLSNFRSEPSSIGTWRLAVENDRSDSRSGWLTGFALNLTGTRQATPTFAAETVVNAASRMGDSVAPGELVSIYGIAIGPAMPVSAPAGALPTTLGGTTVTFDGVAVPISYASLYRVDIQAPFGLQSGIQTRIQVNSGTSVQKPVSSSEPGIFTTQPDGTGQVKAINQDGSLNTLARPAPKGSIIAVYGSGLGAVNPPVAAGAVPPTSPLSQTVAAVTASIGGVPARVLFAGLAPGIPGSYQINIEVPATAASGAQELIVSTNNVPSQNGALVHIQ